MLFIKKEKKINRNIFLNIKYYNKTLCYKFGKLHELPKFVMYGPRIVI